MAIVALTTKNYQQTIASGLWIADFYTSTCGPCKLIDRLLREIVSQDPDVNWARCNLEDDPDLATKYQVMGTPTLIFYLDGKECSRMIGGFHSREELLQEISRVLYGE